MEKDTRLTRRISGGMRGYDSDRRLLCVREPAWSAVNAILKAVPMKAGEVNYAARPPERYRQLGAAAKKHWEANRGKSPFVRWHETLCDLKLGPETRYAVLRSLVTDEAHPQWMSGAGQENWPTAPAQMKAEAAAIANPSIAEACLLAMDHDIAYFTAWAPNNANDPARNIDRSENYYLRGLVALGDRRIVPELRRREQAADLSFRLRLKLANALHRLGDSKPLAQLAEKIAAGGEPNAPFALPPSNNRWHISNLESQDFIRTLTDAGLPETEMALAAFAKPGHPLHAFFAFKLKPGGHDPDRRDYTSHPYCLAFHREWLKDTAKSGSLYEIRGNSLHIRYPNGGSSVGGHMASLKDPEARLERVEGRICDDTMLQLAEIIAGLPEYHPLFKDSQARFDHNVKWLGQHNFRRCSSHEARQFGSLRGPLIPDLKPLEQPATAADVEAGRAAFHLDGKGERLDLKLPAWLVLKKDVHGNFVRRRGLVFQAETHRGKKRYGAFFGDGVRAVDDEEVERVEPHTPQAKK